MPNDVFRAVDAGLILSSDSPDSSDGKAASDLIATYGLSNTVGRLRNLTIMVSTDLKPFYEIGRRYPTHIRSGIVKVTGTSERAYINGALLQLLLGDGAKSPPTSLNFVQPTFNIVATLSNPTTDPAPSSYAKVTVFGVKFESWIYKIPADDFVMEAVTFQAQRISFEDK